MPIDPRIVWSEKKQGKGVKIIGTLECTNCNNSFQRDAVAETNEAAWKIKEIISDEIGQHKHG